MAALLSLPDGCHIIVAAMLGQRNGNPRLRTYVRLRTGIFVFGYGFDMLKACI